MLMLTLAVVMLVNPAWMNQVVWLLGGAEVSGAGDHRGIPTAETVSVVLPQESVGETFLASVRWLLDLGNPQRLVAPGMNTTRRDFVRDAASFRGEIRQEALFLASGFPEFVDSLTSNRRQP